MSSYPLRICHVSSAPLTTRHVSSPLRSCHVSTGLLENLPRVLPAAIAADVDAPSWSPPQVFGWLAKASRASDTEMLRTFNCGLGMVLVVAPADAAEVTRGSHRGARRTPTYFDALEPHSFEYRRCSRHSRRLASPTRCASARCARAPTARRSSPSTRPPRGDGPREDGGHSRRLCRAAAARRITTKVLITAHVSTQAAGALQAFLLLLCLQLHTSYCLNCIRRLLPA